MEEETSLFLECTLYQMFKELSKSYMLTLSQMCQKWICLYDGFDCETLCFLFFQDLYSNEYAFGRIFLSNISKRIFLVVIALHSGISWGSFTVIVDYFFFSFGSMVTENVTILGIDICGRLCTCT